jgi:hypothetical protein
MGKGAKSAFPGKRCPRGRDFMALPSMPVWKKRCQAGGGGRETWSSARVLTFLKTNDELLSNIDRRTGRNQKKSNGWTNALSLIARDSKVHVGYRQDHL